MKLNVGKFDRIVRILLVGFLFLFFLNGNVTGILTVGVLGVSIIILTTAILGTCPIYSKLGWNTLKNNN